jgi:hypothetical protein
MHIYSYIYIYIYIHVYGGTIFFTYIYAGTIFSTRTHTYICIHIHTYHSHEEDLKLGMPVSAYTVIFFKQNTHIYIHIIHTYLYIYILTYIQYTYILTHIHTYHSHGGGPETRHARVSVHSNFGHHELSVFIYGI